MKYLYRLFRRRPRVEPVEIGKPVMLSRETRARLMFTAILNISRV